MQVHSSGQNLTNLRTKKKKKKDIHVKTSNNIKQPLTKNSSSI